MNISKNSYSPSSRILEPTAYWHTSDRDHIKGWTGEPVSITGPAGVVFDFGQEVGGKVRVDWGEISGGPAKISFSEALRYLFPSGDSFWPAIDHLPGVGVQLYRGMGEEGWTTPLLRGGFRYLCVRTPRGCSAEIHGIEVELDFYVPPDGEYKGCFESSDDTLNRIWYAAAYTMQVATKRTSESYILGRHKCGRGEWNIFDGAKRDRAVWSMDLSVCIPSFLLSLGEPAITGDSLLTLLEMKDKGLFALRRGYVPHCSFPPDMPAGMVTAFNTFSNYVLWWIRGVYSQYMYTGDREFVREVFKDILKAFEWVESQTRPTPGSKTPLFYANGHNDLSWDYTIRRRGFPCATNIILAVTYEEAAFLAKDVMQNPALGNKMLFRAGSIRRAIFEQGFQPYDLYDRHRGIFRYTTKVNNITGLEANSLAVLHGFVKNGSAHNIMDTLSMKLHVPWGSLCTDRKLDGPFMDFHNMKVMPCITAFEIAALFKLGRVAEALELTERTWAPMLRQDPGSTFWEWYGENGRQTNSFASLCHPWSASILQFITEGLSGVRAKAPGYSRFFVDTSGPASASAPENLVFSIPTPHGPITGEWGRTGRRIKHDFRRCLL